MDGWVAFKVVSAWVEILCLADIVVLGIAVSEHVGMVA
jgi:hypothetical protein